MKKVLIPILVLLLAGSFIFNFLQSQRIEKLKGNSIEFSLTNESLVEDILSTSWIINNMNLNYDVIYNGLKDSPYEYYISPIWKDSSEYFIGFNSFKLYFATDSSLSNICFEKDSVCLTLESTESFENIKELLSLTPKR